MVSRLKKKTIWEILAGMLVLLAIFLLVNKYVLHSRSKINLANQVEQSVVKHINAKNRVENIAKNIEYTKKRNLQREVSNVIETSLIKKDGRWMLGGNNTEYFLGNENGQLTIGSYNRDKKFKIRVEEIGESNSFLGKAKLDLPDNARANKIRIYEQEDYLPIFGYHYVSPDNKKIEKRRHFLEMHLSDFRRQIDYSTNELGCQWMTFGEAMEKYVIPEKKLPRHTCVMTFDDGHKDGYEYIFPVLKEFNVSATFYIISGFIGTPGYLTWEQLDEIYRQGSEVGAHTVSAEGLIKADWFEKREHREFNREDLIWQITESKKQLQAEGYDTKTFAYPLGEWNEEIVNIVKNDGFIAARDTSRDYTTLDPRAPAVGMSSDFIWHMNYYKPELATEKELKNKMGYSGWWQFEDGYQVNQDKNKNIHRLSSLKDLTPKTYELVSLPDKGDEINNKFLLGNGGKFTLEIFASTGEVRHGAYSYLNDIEVAIDDKPYKTKAGQGKKCKVKSGRYYCSFFVEAPLEAGKHIISVTNNYTGFLRLDKFRLFRELDLKESYKLSIMEYE